MAYQVVGWIEVTRDKAVERGAPANWAGVLRLAPLAVAGDAVSNLLFGLAKIRRPPHLFADRGLPADPSPSLQTEIAEGRALEQESEGDMGHTFASWREIREVVWGVHNVDPTRSSWATIFDAIEAFERRLNLRPEALRLVVWASW